MWRHSELFDGTYNFDDLLDAHELLDLKEENERRAREYADRQR